MEPPQLATNLALEDTSGPIVRTTAEVLVDLLLCPLCDMPLQSARTLPCGNSICEECWQAADVEGEMKRCPYDCSKGRHWAGTAHDVILTKIWEALNTAFKTKGAFGSNSEQVANEEAFKKLLASVVAGQWQGATKKSPSAESNEGLPHSISTAAVPSELTSVPATLLPDVLSELDCQICYSALYDPLTTPCGHTFCRTCLLRSIDHSSDCPTCRATMPPPFANIYHAPRSVVLTSLFQNFWPMLWEERKRAILEDNATAADIFDTADSSRLGPGVTLPIFVCTLAFPYMPTFLYIFEPRYKLMIRRCMEADRKFGICLPRPQNAESLPGEDAECPTSRFGTVLRIYNVQYLEDGRSLVETQGEDRFRLERWGVRDGYMIGRVELLPDDGTDGDAEDDEQSSLLSAQALGIDLSDDDADKSVEELLQDASEFITNLRNGSAPWLLQRVELTHGVVPSDPTQFAFWVASLIPVGENERYILLKARGVRTRLRIVLYWVRKLHMQWWFHGGCSVM